MNSEYNAVNFSQRELTTAPCVLLCFPAQANLALLQLKGLEDSYNDELSFPDGSFSINPFGFV